MRVLNIVIFCFVIEVLIVEDIKFKFEGVMVFSVLDMNEGYYQLELDEDSRYLIIFYGIDCKMRYIRLNYGIILVQDIFDKVIDDSIVGLNGVFCIRFVFIVVGKGNVDYDKVFENLFY